MSETQMNENRNTVRHGSLRVWIVTVVLVAMFLVVSSHYTIAENEYAVVTKFGRIVSVKDTAGLHFKLPFVERVTTISKATQLYDIAPSDVITKDKKSMIADDYILWRVTDAKKFTQTLNASVSAAEDRVSVAVYNATKNTLSSMSQDELIEARGERLTKMITEESNSDLGNYGVEIMKAAIKSLDLPDDNKDAVYERMISERQNIAASYKAQGEAQAQKIRNETDRQVAVMKAEAQKQAEITIAEGEAEYMKTIAGAYDTEDKESFYQFLRSLDALKESLTGGEKTIILDRDSPLARVLYGEGLDAE